MLIFHFATLPSGAKMMWQVEHAKDASQAPSKSTWPKKKNTKFPTKMGAKNSPTWFWCAASKTVVPEGTDTWSRIFASHPNKETDHGVNGDTFARPFLRAQVKFKHFDMFQVSIHHDNTPTPPTPFASNGLGTVFREPSLNLK